MLKKYLSIIIVLITVVTLSSPSSAQSEITDQKKAVIQSSCVGAQTILQRIQHNDAATRVNRGQVYETLVSRLMTQLNSRATSKGYNTSAALMVDTTKRYQQALEDFKDHYEDYDNAISGALKVKCKKDPVKFYTFVEEARKQRQNVANDVGTLSVLVGEYRGNVVKLRSEVQ